MSNIFQTICKSRQISYGRKRRAISLNSTDANIYQENRTNTPDELPLHSWIFVQDGEIAPDYLLSRENGKPDTFLITNGGKGDFILESKIWIYFLLMKYL